MINQEFTKEKYDELSNQKTKDKIVKASFAGCPISDRATFSKSSCILPISIMSRKEHEDKRFYATMKLINASFKTCTLLIVDSLYRHTLRIDYPTENDSNLYNKAIEAGDAWLKRNAAAYKQLEIPHKILRWDQYLHHKNFKNQLEIINNLYDTDEWYQKLVNNNSEEYLNRYLNRSDQMNFDYTKSFSFSVNYLKEECAGMCLWVEDQYEFEVYPTGRCPAMVATYEKLIKPFHPRLLRPVAIRFKK